MNMTVARQAHEAKDIALAAWANSADTVQALLSDGIAADTPPKSGSFAGRRFTALHMAAWNANTQMVRLLLDHDADPRARDDNGKTPAELALDLAHNYHAGIPLARVIETIDILVGRGASLRIADENGDSLLHQLYKRGHTGHVELVRFLLEHEVDKDAKNKSGKTPLHQAAGYGDAAVVGALIEHGADVNAMDNEGNTPLMSAAERGYDFVTVTLPNGRNVLQEGSATGRLDCVILLLAAGTNVAARNRAGNTAADIARAKEHLDVLTVLEKPTPAALSASVDAQPATDASLLNAVGATRAVHLLFVTGQRGHAPYGDLMQSVMSSLKDRGVEVKFLGASQVAGPLPESTDHEIIEIAMLACEYYDLPFSSLSVEYKLYTEGANTLGAITIERGDKASSPQPTQAATTPAGFQTFTSSDNSFSIAYPGDWQQTDAPSGTGPQFTSQDLQKVFGVIAAKRGTSQADPATAASAACSGAGGTPSSPQTISIGGQSWTRVECDTSGGSFHLVAEAVLYKGNLFLIVYVSPKASFDSDASQFFTPMEQSFQFLSVKPARDMNSCSYCGNPFQTLRPELYLGTAARDMGDIVLRMQTGCGACGIPVCFDCAASAADKKGLRGHCVCPGCGANLDGGPFNSPVADQWPSAAKPPATTSQGITTQPGIGFIDLRSDEEREMAERSRSEHERIAYGLGVADLTSELISLVGEDNSGFANRARIREIGEELYRRGGHKLMQEAYYHVRSTKIYFSQDIWDRIGEWQA